MFELCKCLAGFQYCVETHMVTIQQKSHSVQNALLFQQFAQPWPSGQSYPLFTHFNNLYSTSDLHMMHHPHTDNP